MMRGSGSYIPPHRRNKGSEDKPASMTLEQMAVSSDLEIRVEFDPKGPFDTSNCPLDLKEDNGAWKGVLEYEMLIEGRKELLEWFKASSSITSESHPKGDIRSRIVLPCSLSKEDRASWHRRAEICHLGSASEGVGDARHLCIFSEALAELGVGSCFNMTPPEIRKETMDVWKICQEEGGKFWSYSQDEIAEMLLSSKGLSLDIQEILTKREKANLLADYLRTGNQDAALEILTELPRVAYIRDEKSSGFAIHLACFKGLTKVVNHLMGMSGVLLQKDGRHKTALDIAKARGFQEVIDILKGAGAVDHGRSHQDDSHLLGEEYLAPASFGKNPSRSGFGQRTRSGKRSSAGWKSRDRWSSQR